MSSWCWLDTNWPKTAYTTVMEIRHIQHDFLSFSFHLKTPGCILFALVVEETSRLIQVVFCKLSDNVNISRNSNNLIWKSNDNKWKKLYFLVSQKSKTIAMGFSSNAILLFAILHVTMSICPQCMISSMSIYVPKKSYIERDVITYEPTWHQTDMKVNIRRIIELLDLLLGDLVSNIHVVYCENRCHKNYQSPLVIW